MDHSVFDTVLQTGNSGCCYKVTASQQLVLIHVITDCLVCSKQKMLIYDPPQRISAIGALRHPYFADLDTDSLPAK